MKTPRQNRRELAFRREPEQKREMLIASARALFAAKGFDKASTLEIAQNAGVSEGILFHHFGSKRELFNRLAEDYGRQCAAAVMPDAEPITEESIVRSAFEFAEQDRALYRLYATTSSKQDAFEGTPMSEAIIAAIQKNLELGMEEGSIRRGDVRVMAELQYAVVDAAYRAWYKSGDPTCKEHYIDEAICSMKAMLAPLT